MYGFPWDPRLWAAFFVHDLGYFGKPNMDGAEGERHVEWGAGVMGKLFGKEWEEFTLYHSRFYAKKNEKRFSALCVADKLAICITWRWLYLFQVNLTGEVHEYMKLADKMSDLEVVYPSPEAQRTWHSGMTKYVRSWVNEHRDGRQDTWTRDKTKSNAGSDGVWI